MLHFGGRTISRASSRDSWLCEPASLRGCHLSVGLRCPAANQSSTGGPVIRRPLVQEDRNLRLGMVGGTGEVRRPKYDKDTESRSAMLRKFPWGRWLPDRLRQPDYLPSGSVFWTKEEDSRLCVPTSRQVCLYRCNHFERTKPLVQVGQTSLNIRSY